MKFWQKNKNCRQKIETTVKRWNFGKIMKIFRKRLKLWQRIELSEKKWNFSQIFNIQSKDNFGKTWNFRKKLKLRQNIEILVKSWNSSKTLKYYSNSSNHDQTYDFRRKLSNVFGKIIFLWFYYRIVEIFLRKNTDISTNFAFEFPKFRPNNLLL